MEAAFRVSKHDLEVRPVFYWKPRRIAAHMAICFTAYALVKHLEDRVRLCYRKLSIKKIRQLLIGVKTSILFDKEKRIRYGLPSKMKKDYRKIYNARGEYSLMLKQDDTVQFPIEFILNGKPISVRVTPDTTILRFLRDDLHLTGIKNGCSTNHCGACMVLVGRPAHKIVFTQSEEVGR